MCLQKYQKGECKMGFFDKAKEAAQNVSAQAKDAYNNAKAASEEKKAQKEAHEQEMREKAAKEAEERNAAIIGNFTGNSYFDGIDMESLLSFTNEFYCKMVLPAASLANTCIDMYHYIDERVEKKIKKTFSSHAAEDENDKVLLYLRASKKSEVILTKQRVAFSEPLEEDNKFYVEGSIPLDKISSIKADFSGDKLKEAGIISEEEFNQKKEALLSKL